MAWEKNPEYVEVGKWHGHPWGMQRIWLVSCLLQNRYKHKTQNCLEQEPLPLHCRISLNKIRAGWSLQPFLNPEEEIPKCRMASLAGWTCWMLLEQTIPWQTNSLSHCKCPENGSSVSCEASDPNSSALLASSGDKMGHAAHRKSCSMFVSFSAIYRNV